MERIYEGMYLLDNAVVREDWNAAKSIVTDTLEKHGATIRSARRWDERRLTYPMKGKNRATFLLTYFNIPAENIPAMRREFDLNESVLRTMELLVDAIPAEETELASKETSEEFKVPTPPDDDHIEFVEEEDDDDYPRARRDDRRRDDDRPARDDDRPARDSGGDDEKKADAPAADTETKSEGAVTASKED